jgi:UDP-glucose 4-epimerase
MRVLVTGAAGYVGRAVVHHLSRAGHEVVGMVRTPPVRPLPRTVHVVTARLEDVESLRSALAGVEGVCHLAALTRVRDSFDRPTDYFHVNVTGTLNLLDALAAESGRLDGPARLVLASTGAVYGVPDVQPITEDQAPHPLNPYGASKLAAEQAVGWQAATGALGAVTLRAFNVAGAVGGHADPDDTRIIPKALAVAAGQAPRLEVNGDGSAVRDFVHVGDLASAFVMALAACEPGAHRIYNACGGHGVSVRDVISAVERVTGRVVSVHWGPPKPEPAVLLGDNSAIMADLGWSPRESGLDEIVRDAWQAIAN